MKTSAVLLPVALAFFVIGVYETITNGIVGSYWLFMLTGALLIIIQMKRKQEREQK